MSNISTEDETFEPFGEEFGKKYFLMEEGWMNLNHGKDVTPVAFWFNPKTGSYGTCPKPVMEAFHKLQSRAESFPDRFMRREYMPLLSQVRERVSKMVNCDRQDLVFVPNATTGVNIALHSVPYQVNDAILYIDSTVYSACHTSINYIIDSKPSLNLRSLAVPTTYPISDQALLDSIEKTIVDHEASHSGSKVRVALIDAISSNPGVVVPWERVISLLRRLDVLSIIDGAHAIGQIPLNLKVSDPDWFVSNMHKWAFAHRAAALFYCKRERQWNTHSMPISHFYHSPEHPSAEPARDPKEWQSYWVGEFEWIGTQDWSPILSIPAALDFRENACGGEERIRCWCNNLAKNAGVEMARIFGEGSIVMQNEEETLIASMVNISLPLKVSDNASVRAKQHEYMIEQMLQHTFFIAISFYDGRLWLRASAQVYTELHMFISAAEMIKEWCKIAADFRVELDESDS